MKVNEKVRGVIEKGICENNKFFLPKIQLNRKDYSSVNKVLECVGGKWNRKEKAHVFKGDANVIIKKLIDEKKVINKKKENGFFETPDKVIDQMLDLINIEDKSLILEPSAGYGAIVKKIIEKNPTVGIICIEKDQEAYSKLFFNFVDNTNIQCYNENFLKNISILLDFDYIIANPPFNKFADVDHVTEMIKYLKPTGVLISIMSSGITYRNDKKTKKLREFILEYGEIIPLPEKSFKESGTLVDSVIVKISGSKDIKRTKEEYKILNKRNI